MIIRATDEGVDDFQVFTKDGEKVDGITFFDTDTGEYGQLRTDPSDTSKIIVIWSEEAQDHIPIEERHPDAGFWLKNKVTGETWRAPAPTAEEVV